KFPISATIPSTGTSTSRRSRRAGASGPPSSWASTREGIMTTRHVALALIGTLLLAACNFDVGDLNRPGLNQVLAAPTPAAVAALATGLVAGERADIASRIG